MDRGSSNLCCSRTHSNYTATIAKEWPREARLQVGFWEKVLLYLHIPLQHLILYCAIFYSKASQSILLVSPFIEPLLSFPNQSCPYLLAPEPFSLARLSCKCILPVLTPYLLCLLSHTCAHPSFMKHPLLLPFRFASQLSTFPPSSMLTHPLILAPMYWSAPKPSPQNSPLTSLTS